MIRAILLLALLLPYLNASASNFPRPASLEPAVEFWIKVYTEIVLFKLITKPVEINLVFLMSSGE